MNDLHRLKFFATHPHPCSYLDEEATTVFVDPNIELNGSLYSQLSDFGFRRSGRHVYRPNCKTCNACIPIRLPVDNFLPSRSQKRCLKRNQDLKATEIESILTQEHYELYERYISLRHNDGDMYPPSWEQYADFLTSEWGITRYLEFRDEENKLIAVSVIDKLDHGASAIYFFFDPEEEKRSLGMFNILFLVQWSKQMGLPFVFLGYWIKKCQKMNYKTRYRPFQVLINDTWVTVSDGK